MAKEHLAHSILLKSIFYVTLCAFFSSCSILKPNRKAIALPPKMVDSILAQDQKYRWMIMFDEYDTIKLDSMLSLPDEIKFKLLKEKYHNRRIGDSKQILRDSVLKLQNEIDSSNFNLVKFLIFEKRIKWNFAFDIVLWHQRNGKLEKLLPKIHELMLQKQIPAEFYARTIDNMEIQKRKKQIYGTITESDDSIIHNKTNLKIINKARKSIGLKKLKLYK